MNAMQVRDAVADKSLMAAIYGKWYARLLYLALRVVNWAVGWHNESDYEPMLVHCSECGTEYDAEDWGGPMCEGCYDDAYHDWVDAHYDMREAELDQYYLDTPGYF